MNDLKKPAEPVKLKQLVQIKADRQLSMVRYSPDGKLLAGAGQDGAIRRWDVATDKPADLPSLAGHNGWVQCLAFHPDGKRLFTADSWGAVRCFATDAKDAKPTWENPAAHDGWIHALVLSPDGARFASAGNDRVVRLFSADGGKPVKEFAGHENDIHSLAFHPDGKSLVSGDAKGVVKQWDLATGKPTRTFDASILHKLDRLQDSGGVRVLAFVKGGATLVAAGCATPGGGFVQGVPAIAFFDWAGGKQTKVTRIGKETDGFVHDLHVHADGYLMAVTSGQPGNGKVFFLRPDDADPFFIDGKLPNCHSLALRPDGARLAVVSVNGGSNGNGRQLAKNGEYLGNHSPVTIFEMPVAKAAKVEKSPLDKL